METEETLEGTMGRPERHDVDYFPFFVKSGKTLDYLELKYGPEGTGYFTNILRFLSTTPDHHFCVKNETDMMIFLSRIKSSDEKKTMDIINIMVKTGKLDRELWEKHKVIVSEAFLNSLEEAYKYRNNRIITIDEIRSKFKNQQGNTIKQRGNEVNQQGNSHTAGFPSEIHEDNPQSKVKKSKVKESKENSKASPPVVSENPLPSKPEKPKKPQIREREPENDMERVEKAYRENWDFLFSQGKVKTSDPIVNWKQTRALLKRHFEKLKPDQIIAALKTGMTDDWVMNKGYSLGMMLAASVLNRLINVYLPEKKQFGKPSEGTVDINALYKQFGLTGSESEKRRKLIELRDQGRVSF